jgi:hypothetical protein
LGKVGQVVKGSSDVEEKSYGQQMTVGEDMEKGTGDEWGGNVLASKKGFPRSDRLTNNGLAYFRVDPLIASYWARLTKKILAGVVYWLNVVATYYFFPIAVVTSSISRL